MVGFRKGALGSPFSTEYQGNEGMDLGDAKRGQSGPRIGAGVEGKRVTMEVQRDGSGGKSSGRGKKRGSAE